MTFTSACDFFKCAYLYITRLFENEARNLNVYIKYGFLVITKLSSESQLAM